MTFQELQTYLLALTPAEQAQVIQLLVQQLSNTWPGIEKTVSVAGGSACIANTRIPVWDLVQYRRMGASEGKILEAYPQLSAADLAHAWGYAAAHPEEIDTDIAQNAAA